MLVLLNLGLALAASLEAAIPVAPGWRIELPGSCSAIVFAPGRERVLQRRTRSDPDLAEDGDERLCRMVNKACILACQLGGDPLT